MKKWKKFIAMGLAVSMIVPSCIPQTLWASEFSAGSVESAADVFEDIRGKILLNLTSFTVIRIITISQITH